MKLLKAFLGAVGVMMLLGLIIALILGASILVMYGFGEIGYLMIPVLLLIISIIGLTSFIYEHDEP